MPQIGNKRRNVIGERFRVFRLGRRKQKRPATLVRKDGRGQPNLHSCPLFAHLRQKVRDAKFAAFTKLRDGAEKALRRFWRAQRGAEFHHRLVPVAGRSRVEIRVRAFLQLLPTTACAQISANSSHTRNTSSSGAAASA